jgi:hypothetical protein
MESGEIFYLNMGVEHERIKQQAVWVETRLSLLKLAGLLLWLHQPLTFSNFHFGCQLKLLQASFSVGNGSKECV